VAKINEFIKICSDNIIIMMILLYFIVRVIDRFCDMIKSAFDLKYNSWIENLEKRVQIIERRLDE